MSNGLGGATALDVKRFYIPCQVSPGLFNSEFYIMFYESGAYVNTGNVRVDIPPTSSMPSPGMVLAYLVEEKGADALVEVSGEPVVGGLRTWVPKAELLAA